MSQPDNQVIHAFDRSRHEKVQITVRKFNEKYYVDLRVWFQTKEDPTYKPTRKGLSFKLDYLSELNQGIQRLMSVREKYREIDENSDQ